MSIFWFIVDVIAKIVLFIPVAILAWFKNSSWDGFKREIRLFIESSLFNV